MAISPTLAIRIRTIAYTKLYDRRWVDRPPVGLIPNATPNENVRTVKITQGKRKSETLNLRSIGAVICTFVGFHEGSSCKAKTGRYPHELWAH